MEDQTPTAEGKSFAPDTVDRLLGDLALVPSSSDTSPEISGAFPIPPTNRRAAAGGPGSCSDMSASYHEIFDTQMPPETALTTLTARVGLGSSPEDESDLEVELPRDETAGDTTNYLTSKLVQDSLLWQERHPGPHPAPSISPLGSPRRMPPASIDPPRRPSTSVNPVLLAGLEHDARLLATSVDGLVENLSGILQSISALTVETIETYRDGVCKTCDQVDSNIKSMYQVMAKVEELNKSMAPAYKLGEQLKEIKRLLDMYEAVAHVKP